MDTCSVEATAGKSICGISLRSPTRFTSSLTRHALFIWISWYDLPSLFLAPNLEIVRYGAKLVNRDDIKKILDVGSRYYPLSFLWRVRSLLRTLWFTVIRLRLGSEVRVAHRVVSSLITYIVLVRHATELLYNMTWWNAGK